MITAPFTVLVADDHPIVRSGVRLLLRSEADFVLLGEPIDDAQTFAAVERDHPDLLILDLWMGGNDGFELIRRIRAAFPLTRILIYSMNDERVAGPRALRAGAVGYVMKDRGLDELLAALRTVASGKRYLSAILAEALVDSALRTLRGPTRSKPDEFSTLSDRELQVLRLIGFGQPSANIAEALRISPKTVGAHREHLKNKLQLSNSAELAKLAVLMVKSRRL